MIPLSDRTSIVVRATDERDLDAVLLLLEPFVERELLLPRSREEVAELLPTSFCATNDEVIVGFAAVEIYSRKLAEIQCLAVHDDCQRLGIGRRLVKKCIELSRTRGVLELMAISASDQFLRECGFDYSLPNQKRALFYWPVEEGP